MGNQRSTLENTIKDLGEILKDVGTILFVPYTGDKMIHKTFNEVRKIHSNDATKRVGYTFIEIAFYPTKYYNLYWLGESIYKSLT